MTQYSNCGNYKFENSSLYILAQDEFIWYHIGLYPHCETIEQAVNTFNMELEERHTL